MKFKRVLHFDRAIRTASWFVAMAALLAGAKMGAQGVAAAGQKAGKPGMGKAAAEETVPALFLSDIHFEAFFDPGKVPRLAAAPVAEWKGILGGPPSPDRAERFAALQQSCPTRGEDTSFPLFESSLKAVRQEAAGARFATLSGDLISHSFTCKFGAVFPHAASGDYRAFVEKAIDFVIEQVKGAIPGAPLYVALGNNDSDCEDYKLDPNGEFLSAMGKEITGELPVSERSAAEQTFSAAGYYSAALPGPIRNARMLVVDDIFMSSRYQTCGGKLDAGPADAQLAWLERQLTEARSSHERVWVMGHIPPGVDIHSTATHMEEACGKKGPRMFLSSEKMADLLVEFSDVVELGIFAHTHMDEVRLLTAQEGKDSGGSVAIKMVSSISPINGNAPSFTVARVEPGSARLKDFRVFRASNASGLDTLWKEEYDWGKTFREPDFDGETVKREIAGFKADSSGSTDASRDYMLNFFAGNASPLLALVWPQYVCTLGNDSAEGFKKCVCPAGP